MDKKRARSSKWMSLKLEVGWCLGVYDRKMSFRRILRIL